jgi:hypothetical protein
MSITLLNDIAYEKTGETYGLTCDEIVKDGITNYKLLEKDGVNFIDLGKVVSKTQITPSYHNDGANYYIIKFEKEKDNLLLNSQIMRLSLYERGPKRVNIYI